MRLNDREKATIAAALKMFADFRRAYGDECVHDEQYLSEITPLTNVEIYELRKRLVPPPCPDDPRRHLKLIK